MSTPPTVPLSCIPWRRSGASEASDVLCRFVSPDPIHADGFSDLDVHLFEGIFDGKRRR